MQGQDSNKNCTSVMQMMRRPPSLHTSERRNCARPAGGVCCCSALAWACRGRWEPSCSGVVAFGRLIGPVSLVGLQAVTVYCLKIKAQSVCLSVVAQAASSIARINYQRCARRSDLHVETMLPLRSLWPLPARIALRPRLAGGGGAFGRRGLRRCAKNFARQLQR